MIRRHAGTGRLLEIGPGAGMFAHLMATSGYEVETIEMAERSAKFIQEVLGITTHRTDDEGGVCKGAAAIVMAPKAAEQLPQPPKD